MLIKLSIKHKLLFVSVLTTLIVMVFATGFWAQNSINTQQNHLNKRIDNQANIISSNIIAAVVFEDSEEIQLILKALATDDAILSARLEKLDTELIVKEKFTSIKEKSTNFFDRILRFIHPIHENEKIFYINFKKKRIANLFIYYSNKEVHDLLLNYILSSVVIIIIATLIVAGLSLLIQPLVTRPIAHLSNLARKVRNSNDYSLRGQFFYPDEMGDLTTDFNAMLDIIEQRENDLENLVLQRTAQLEKRNNELQQQIVERKRSESLRQESEERFEKAFINAPIGMALLDKTGLIFRHNQALKKILNYYYSDTFNNTIRIQEIIEPSQLTNINRQLQKLVSGENIQFEVEVECFVDTDSPLLIILSFSAVYNTDNHFLYIVLQFQDVTSARRMAADLQYQATHDSLTGVGNRRHLEKKLDSLSRATRSHTTSLCIMDLDQFKVVNDSCGHLAGDELLKQVAEILKSSIRENDFVARLGGDEFAFILSDCDRNKARKITEKLRQKIEQFEFLWEDRMFRVGCSIGVVCVAPDDNMNVAYLMQKADAACYAAKDLGRNRVYLAEDEDLNIINRQGEIQWVNKINDALIKGNLVLFVQQVCPLIEPSAENRFEVLVRMKDRNSELISPGSFIPIAERYGLTPKIDRWVIHELIAILTAKPELAQNHSYWVNLSGLSISDIAFINEVEALLEKSCLSESMINFEITETSVMRNLKEAESAMERLHSIGCQFALDDFGSGASSFGYLKNLPVDYIKIDGMFVKDIVIDEIDKIFVKSIVDIAKVMKIKTVAEFVESEAIKSELLEMGADYAQGFIIGKPYPLIETDDI